ncbi:hypothetical protein [Devosia sp. A449]
MTKTLSDPPNPDNPEIEYSIHGGEHWEGELLVWVKIYRLAGTTNPWILEVEGTDGSSTVWDEPFDTDDAAWMEFQSAISQSGLEQFYDDDDMPVGTLH